MSESETESAKCQMWVYFWRANIVRLLVPNKKEKKKTMLRDLATVWCHLLANCFFSSAVCVYKYDTHRGTSCCIQDHILKGDLSCFFRFCPFSVLCIYILSLTENSFPETFL